MRHSPSVAAVVAALLLAAGCDPSDTRRAAAEEFIDRLYVVIDQRAARELAVGLAVAKLDEEIRLTAGQAIDESTRKPRVRYRFVQLAEGSDANTASLVYDLEIAPDGADSFVRRLMLTLRLSDGMWRVANYTLDSAALSD